MRRSPRLCCDDAGHVKNRKSCHETRHAMIKPRHDVFLFCPPKIHHAADAMYARAHAQRRRPRRPPFLLVESEGVGVTSSMRPMRIPARARARRADWAPGPGVLVPLPPVARILTWRAEMPSSLQRAAIAPLACVSPCVCGLFRLRTDVLGSQHGGVGRRLVTVGLDLHATGDTRDGLATRQIGDVDEGVVERGEDAGNAKDELALADLGTQLETCVRTVIENPSCRRWAKKSGSCSPGCSPAHRARPSSWEACWL
jgi:hypothetical protein